MSSTGKVTSKSTRRGSRGHVHTLRFTLSATTRQQTAALVGTQSRNGKGIFICSKKGHIRSLGHPLPQLSAHNVDKKVVVTVSEAHVLQ